MSISTIITGGNNETRFQAIPQKWSSSDSDVKIISLQEDESNIGIETIREAQSFLSTHPISRQEKILIVDSAEKLTVEAQNALLKTLEEPPARAVIYLLTTNSDLLLPTVLSRCLSINLPVELQAKDEQWEKLLTVLDNADLGERLEIASRVAKSREEAIKSLQSLLVSERELIISPKSSLKDSHRVIKILEAIKRLNSNTNVRLVIENLLINW